MKKRSIIKKCETINLFADTFPQTLFILLIAIINPIIYAVLSNAFIILYVFPSHTLAYFP